MGGKALKHCILRRINAAEYASFTFRVLTIVRRHYVHVDVPHSFPTKLDHGDLDVVVSVPLTDVPARVDLPSDVVIRGKLVPRTRAIANEFQSKEVFANGPVISFESEQFQVDLIHVRPEEFAFACAYLSWGDLGNMIGIVANRLGMSYGSEGLAIRVFSPRHGNSGRIGRVELTADVGEALEFLGYNAERWKRGFENREDVFAYVVSGAYFEPWMFLRRNMNNRNRRRIRKRPMFDAFLGYLRGRFPDEGGGERDETHEESAESGEKNDYNDDGDDGDDDSRDAHHELTPLQLQHRARALERFGKQVEYQAHMNRYERGVLVKERWTPAVRNIQETRGLKDKALGQFIATYRETKVGKEGNGEAGRTWEDWVMAQESAENIVRDMVVHFDSVWRLRGE
ncbi:hypothetical protein BC938DRAFT_474982 [Jimgerdemannia flammicorona]|uniref:Uncharacterized protein n=1 Tax=Jimgerdemannia flammicorona TaxID=994334 RepID=A0A433Q1B3_9FUNG|nr:hypothetical protein BC938DRAFT_474982 [Jimgerdemannia flammicorona]